MRNISVIWNKEIPPAHTFKVNTKEKKMLPKIKKKKLYWCHFLSDSGGMFEMPLSLSPCRASKSNHSLWLQQYLERCKNWFSVHVCVCALVGAEGAACLCRCVYLFIYFIFFWGGGSVILLPAGFGFCVPVCVYACICVCTDMCFSWRPMPGKLILRSCVAGALLPFEMGHTAPCNQ